MSAETPICRLAVCLAILSIVFLVPMAAPAAEEEAENLKEALFGQVTDRNYAVRIAVFQYPIQYALSIITIQRSCQQRDR